jgi:glycerol-3-phosphate dehydrogenase (NAD(P)+)
MQIAVLGAGSWGTTLALMLCYNAHQVVLWSYLEDLAQLMAEQRENSTFLPGIKLPPELVVTADVELAVRNTQMVVAAVPSQHLRSVLMRVKSADLCETILVNVAKGIENDSLMTMSEVMQDVLQSCRKENLAILSGPSHAEEVSRQIPTAVVAAAKDLRAAKVVQQTFMTPYFRVYTSDDLRGVELGGALKNVIAIGAGISDGAGFGDNTKAAIMTRGTAEISRLGILMGAQPRTFAGLSGIGDLIVTCMSRHSRNRHVGEEIGKGRKLDDVLNEMVMVAEGVATTRSAYDLARQNHVELPIIAEVHEVLFQDKDPIIATSDLMTRDAKGELEGVARGK